jgi:long-chain acyl-CoA synthetase
MADTFSQGPLPTDQTASLSFVPPPAHLAYEPGVPATIDYPRQPLHALLRAASGQHPNRTAVVFQGATTTYEELDRLADACAAGLQAAGVNRGDRVALVLPNIPQYPIAVYGALRAGGVIVGCNPLYTAHELAFQLADSGAETVIVLDRFLAKVEQAIMLAHNSTKPCAVKRIYVADVAPFLPAALRVALWVKRRKDQVASFRPGTRKAPGARPVNALEPASFEELLNQYRGTSYHEVDAAPEDLAALQYTGGTTGGPKGAMLTHGNLLANTLQVRSWSPELQPGAEIILCVAPFFHIYGLTVALNVAVSNGATMVLLPRFKIEEVAAAIKRYRPTLWPAVPTMYAALADLIEKSGVDCRSLKICISGAAPLPLDVQQRFERLTGSALVEGYGLSEASPVTHCNPVRGKRVAGSIGVTYPDTEARLDTTVVPENDDPALGELLVRGPQVMRGYWNRPAETAAVLQDGWLRTGDIARVDANGYYYIVDRAKDIIIAGGFNIYPREVEEVLYLHPQIREAVVVGMPDHYRGQTVKAFIVPRDAPSEDGVTAAETQVRPLNDAAASVALRAEIDRFCRERLAAYKVPKHIEFRAELPKSAIGKHLRRILRDEDASSTAAGDADGFAEPA